MEIIYYLNLIFIVHLLYLCKVRFSSAVTLPVMRPAARSSSDLNVIHYHKVDLMIRQNQLTTAKINLLDFLLQLCKQFGQIKLFASHVNKILSCFLTN